MSTAAPFTQLDCTCPCCGNEGTQSVQSIASGGTFSSRSLSVGGAFIQGGVVPVVAQSATQTQSDLARILRRPGVKSAEPWIHMSAVLGCLMGLFGFAGATSGARGDAPPMLALGVFGLFGGLTILVVTKLQERAQYDLVRMQQRAWSFLSYCPRCHSAFSINSKQFTQAERVRELYS